MQSEKDDGDSDDDDEEARDEGAASEGEARVCLATPHSISAPTSHEQTRQKEKKKKKRGKCYHGDESVLSAVDRALVHCRRDYQHLRTGPDISLPTAMPSTLRGAARDGQREDDEGRKGWDGTMTSIHESTRACAPFFCVVLNTCTRPRPLSASVRPEPYTLDIVRTWSSVTITFKLQTLHTMSYIPDGKLLVPFPACP